MAVTQHAPMPVWDHEVYFHEGDSDLAERVGSYLTEALDAHEVAVVIATAEHVAAFAAYLAASGRDLAAARAGGSVVVIDARGAMQWILVDGMIDADRFDAAVGGAVREAVAHGRRVRIYGEVVGCLWESGCMAAAVDLEGLWNDLAGRLPFSLLCGYPAGSVVDDEEADALLAVCRLHSHVGGSVPVTPGRGRDTNVTGTARTFSPSADAPRRARHFVIETLRGAGRLDFVEDASLVVTELATNAVVHASTEFTVSVVVTGAGGDAVRISVRDWSPEQPVPVESPGVGPSGRGLRLVIALAARWGSEPLSDGKVVWVELSL